MLSGSPPPLIRDAKRAVGFWKQERIIINILYTYTFASFEPPVGLMLIPKQQKKRSSI